MKHQALASAIGLVVTLACSSCASVTGLVTGAGTGMIDAPAEVYRHHTDEFAHAPLYWSFNVLVFGPLGLVVGPVSGLAKGIALDLECMLGQNSYGRVFGRLGPGSIWRPYAFDWNETDTAGRTPQ